VVNWEAVTMIGGAAVLLCIVLAVVVISVRRERSPQDGPLDVPMPATGLVLHSLQVVAMLAGVILAAFAFDSGWKRLLFCLIYFPGTFLATALVGNFLERRGVKVVGTNSEGSPPNKSLERTREG
jgi:hypothetical protein